MIDCHAHLCTSDVDSYPPGPLKGVLEPHLLADPMPVERLLRLMDENGVERAIAVQRVHIYGYDNSYVVDSAARYPDRLSAMVCVNSEDPAAQETIRYWVEERGAVAVRMTTPADPATGDLAYDRIDWVDGATAMEAWRAIDRLGVTGCIHFYPRNRVAGLAAFARVHDAVPNLPVVMDHLTGILPEGDPLGYVPDQPLRDLAAVANVTLKLSMINLSKFPDEAPATAAALAQLIALFGADRIMWGSDVAQSRGSYAHFVERAKIVTERLDAAGRDAILDGTTRRFYGL